MKKSHSGWCLLEIREHDFITILGGNGAGKSTLFNTIAGHFQLVAGRSILGEDVTTTLLRREPSTYLMSFKILNGDQRLHDSGRKSLGSEVSWKNGLIPRHLASYKEEFQTVLYKIGNGLENHIDTAVEFLSGGNQALSLLMATLNVQNFCY